MATLVCFHAHPDDECLATGGTIARAVAEGHRVVLVVATNGEHGECPSNLLNGEFLADRRFREVQESSRVLGISRIEMLNYRDSGMTGWAQNQDPRAFMNADIEVAAGRLAAILMDEGATALTTYDWHGNYGHPDHVMVHKVGHRAAQIAGVSEVFEMTTNRDEFRRLRTAAMQDPALTSTTDGIGDFDPDGPADDGNPMGEPESNITHKIDVQKYCKIKRRAIACHASQVSDTSFFLNMSDEVFAKAFGTEWFIRHGETGPPRSGWLFE